MPELLKLVHSVYFAGIIDFRIDAHNRRDINNGAEAEALPNIRSGEDGSEPAGFHHEVYFFHAKLSDECIDDTVCRRQEVDDHTGNDNRGDEMREIGYRLCEPFERAVFNFNYTDSE